MYRVLCVEDSVEVQVVVKRSLFPLFQVTTSTTIQLAKRLMSRECFDLVILDLGLPDGDGLAYCKELKSSLDLSSIPIFLLTSSQSIQEKVMGFSLGVEDYISKPFDPIELKIRIEARLGSLMRMQQRTQVLSIGLLRIDFLHQRASLALDGGNESLDLSYKEFKLLVFLAKNLDQVKSRESIISAVWSDGLHLSDRVVDSHVSRIRKKIRNGDCTIEAVQNLGYRLSVWPKKQAA